ncbi:MAG: D-alanyl-D-alanine carboxypeptidase [Holosporales bacterium]|nr:D-alanyl-D-alanine carboxypeptidase [Holosporales bacterium]
MINYTNGKIVFNKNATKTLYPASLTKMMTVYLLLEAIRQNKITFNTKFKASKLATMQSPSKLGFKVGEKITVLNLLQALTVKSANDAAVVAAEGLCGSINAFSQLMTAKARQLGMLRTNFRNPSGLPDSRQVSCAKDIATLGISLFRNFPQYWYLFSLKSFCYKGRTHYTHCKILNWCKGTDGGKTGFICASGFNLFVTAKRYNNKGDSKRVVIVVLGSDSSKSRDLYAAYLINKFLSDYTICSPIKKNNKPKLDNERASLMRQIDFEEKMKISPKMPQLIEPVIHEEEEFSVDEILKAEKMKKEEFDEMYGEDEDVLEIDEEVCVNFSNAGTVAVNEMLAKNVKKIPPKRVEHAKKKTPARKHTNACKASRARKHLETTRH